MRSFHPSKPVPPGLPFTTAPALPPGERPPPCNALRTNWAKESGNPVKSACLSCRAKKAKCDGVQPICGQCNKKKIECIFIRSKRGGARKKIDLLAPTPLARFLRRLDKLASAPDLYNIPLSPVPADEPLDVVREFTSREELLKAYYVEVHPYLALMPPRHYMKDVLPTLLPESPFLLACETILVLAPHPSDPHPRSIQSKSLRMAKARELNLKTMEAVERSLANSQSLECVQALIILSIYEWGSTGNQEMNQIRSAQAMQVAMGMGLHELDKETTGGEAQTLEGIDWRKDMMRRTWWFTYMYQLIGAIASGSLPLVAADDPRVFVDFPICSPNDRTWSNWVQSLRQCSRVLALVNSVVFRNGQVSDGYGTPSDSISKDELARRKNQLVAIEAQIVDMMKEAERLSIIGHVVGREEEVAHNLQIAIRLCLAATHIHIHRHQAFPEVSFFTKQICGLPKRPSMDLSAEWSEISAHLSGKSSNVSRSVFSNSTTGNKSSPAQTSDHRSTPIHQPNSTTSDNVVDSIESVFVASSLKPTSTISPHSYSPAQNQVEPAETNLDANLCNRGITLNEMIDPYPIVSQGSGPSVTDFPSSESQSPSTGMRVSHQRNEVSPQNGLSVYTMIGFDNKTISPGPQKVDESVDRSHQNSSFDSGILNQHSNGGSFSSVGSGGCGSFGSVGGSIGNAVERTLGKMPSISQDGTCISEVLISNRASLDGFAPPANHNENLAIDKGQRNGSFSGSFHRQPAEGYKQTVFQPAFPPTKSSSFSVSSNRDSLVQVETAVGTDQLQIQTPTQVPILPGPAPITKSTGFYCTGYTSAGLTQPGYIAEPGYGTTPINSYTNTEANLAAFDLPIDPKGLPTIQYAAYARYPNYSTTPMGLGLVSNAARDPSAQVLASVNGGTTSVPPITSVDNSSLTFDPLMYEVGLFEPKYMDGRGPDNQFPSGDLFAAANWNPFAYGFPVPPNITQPFEQNVAFPSPEAVDTSVVDNICTIKNSSFGSAVSPAVESNLPPSSACQLSLNLKEYQGKSKIPQTGHVNSLPPANRISQGSSADLTHLESSQTVNSNRSSKGATKLTPHTSKQNAFQKSHQNEPQSQASRYADYEFIEEMWVPEKFPDYLPQPWFAQPGGAASLVCAPSEMPLHAVAVLPTEYPMPPNDMPLLQHPATFVPDDDRLRLPQAQSGADMMSLLITPMVGGPSQVAAPSIESVPVQEQMPEIGSVSGSRTSSRSASQPQFSPSSAAPAPMAGANKNNLDVISHQAWGIAADGTVKKEEQVVAEYEGNGAGSKANPGSSSTSTATTTNVNNSTAPNSVEGCVRGGSTEGNVQADLFYGPKQLDDTFPPGISLARCAAAAHTIVRMEIIHRSAAIALNEGPLKWMPFCSCALVSGAFAFLLLALAVQAEKEFDEDSLSEKIGTEVEALYTNVKIIIAALETYGVMWAGIDNMAKEVKTALEAAIALPQEIRSQRQSLQSSSPESQPSSQQSNV